VIAGIIEPWAQRDRERHFLPRFRRRAQAAACRSMTRLTWASAWPCALRPDQL